MNKIEKILSQEKEIIELKLKIEYHEKRCVLREKEVRVEEKAKSAELEKNLAVETTRNEELKNQLEKAPYKQLTDLLKALAVKLPTVDIKSLSVGTQGK